MVIFRQYKDHLRHQRHSTATANSHYQNHLSNGHHAQHQDNNAASSATSNSSLDTSNHHIQQQSHHQPRLTASALARMQMQQHQGPETTSNGLETASVCSASATRSLYDVKAMQKEAVLSYVKVESVFENFFRLYYKLFN